MRKTNRILIFAKGLAFFSLDTFNLRGTVILVLITFLYV